MLAWVTSMSNLMTAHQTAVTSIRSKLYFWIKHDSIFVYVLDICFFLLFTDIYEELLGSSCFLLLSSMEKGKNNL